MQVKAGGCAWTHILDECESERQLGPNITEYGLAGAGRERAVPTGLAFLPLPSRHCRAGLSDTAASRLTLG